MKIIFTISAPSGTGKTTLCKAILKEIPEMIFSVSCTTRSKRKSEIEGEDYYFINHEEFQSKIDNGEFAEYEDVHGQFYGTLKSSIEESIFLGSAKIFEV